LHDVWLSDVIYNVFSGPLNPTQSINIISPIPSLSLNSLLGTLYLIDILC